MGVFLVGTGWFNIMVTGIFRGITVRRNPKADRNKQVRFKVAY